MNILLISYGNYEFDGRLRELYKIACALGDVCFISRGDKKVCDSHYLLNVPYLEFVKKAVQIGKKFPKIDVLFLDNRKSIIPGLKLKKIYKSSRIILDCRELYLSKYVKHLAGKIGCIFEKRGIKKADLVICANQERADFMQEYYKLKNKPFVYENLRTLEYSSHENEILSKEKFEKYNVPNEIRLISTAGCDISRLTDSLVSCLPKIGFKCRLFLVGGGNDKDKKQIERICESNNISNVEIMGMLNQNDLKTLIGYCHIGIVSYHQNDLNNKFCASGKIYEFLYEGLPVVTTTNPPLVNFCKKHKIGESDDCFVNAIEMVAANYSFYKENVLKYCDGFSINDNNSNLIHKIISSLK